MEEKVLVTIREVKEMLQLSFKYRYLDQIVYGKSACQAS